jgi:triosephosphate isomerase
MARRQLIAGNWKMNGLKASLAEADAVAAQAGQAGGAHADVLVCPPFTLLASCAERIGGSQVLLGAQDCHAEPSGAHTGEVSAEMIADAGAGWVIVGHSERRAMGEGDADVRAKALAGLRAGLSVIVCVGETLAERDAGKAIARTGAQVRGSLPPAPPGPGGSEAAVAYEPVWAIGTGRTPSSEEIAEMHAAIRAEITALWGGPAGERVRILYGGSVKPSNAREILAIEGVDGALVGGASLKAPEFLQILKFARTS